MVRWRVGGVIVDMGERECLEELEEVEKGETVFWMYCMREESIFNNKKGIVHVRL